MTNKLGALSAIAPQVNGIIVAIQRRKKRDKVILGVVTSLCCVFLVHYGWG